MAGRPARQAYRMTTRRRAALRKAQIASARKRKRNKKLKIAGAVGVGVLAVGGAAWAGSAIGNGKDIRSGLKNRKLAMNNARNKMAGVISPDAKEAMMRRSAVSAPPERWLGMPGGLSKAKDPVQSAPTPQQAAAQNKPRNQTTPRQSKVTKLPGQTADEGRQNMEGQPKVKANGGKFANGSYEYRAPTQDVWGAPNEFVVWDTDTIISMLPRGEVNRDNVISALNKLAKKQKNLGNPLSGEQVDALRTYYGKKFQLDLSKKKK